MHRGKTEPIAFRTSSCVLLPRGDWQCAPNSEYSIVFNLRDCIHSAIRDESAEFDAICEERGIGFEIRLLPVGGLLAQQIKPCIG